MSAIPYVLTTHLDVRANLFVKKLWWNLPLLNTKGSECDIETSSMSSFDNWRRIEISFFIFVAIKNQFVVFKISMFLWI